MKQIADLIIILFFISIISLTACSRITNFGQPVADSNSDQANEALARNSSGDAIVGQRLFAKNCSACHGQDGEGVKGLGKALVTSEFVAGKTDDELVEFIKVGRDPKDPLNTTGIRMYPKGGNPDLTDADLYDIVAHIRTINNLTAR